MRQRLVFLLLLFFAALPVAAQEENVPVANPVYDFLKRMELKGVIEHYYDAVLPISRREVAEFLTTTEKKQDMLTEVDRGRLRDLLSEFQYDITGTTENFHRLIQTEEPDFGSSWGAELSQREKYVYFYHDSTLSFFVNGLLEFNGRTIQGDALGKTKAEFLQAGGRMRGTILGHLGYYAQWTNAQFWGSRELLERDPLISQSHTLTVGDAQNFDFADSYVRYGNSVVSAQVGRERVLWGVGYNQKMTLSANPRTFDFFRVDAKYKAIKYTFLHAWLLGPVGTLNFKVPADTAATFQEDTASDKYFVAHRIDFSFPGVIDLGLQEMLIYSNRSPDLAYLNPLTIVESSQRSRGERDNALWELDMQLHFIPRIELIGSIVYDDIHVPQLFTSVWYDRYAWQTGMMYVDMFGLENTNLMVEYTRVEPFMYAHPRSRADSYTSLDRLLGPTVGPNGDEWFFRVDYLPSRNLTLSFRVSFDRKGENIVGADGQVIKNVGSDPLVPHSSTDPERKKWLDGILVRNRHPEFLATWEVVNQMWLEGHLLFDSEENTVTGVRNENTTAIIGLRMEL